MDLSYSAVLLLHNLQKRNNTGKLIRNRYRNWRQIQMIKLCTSTKRLGKKWKKSNIRRRHIRLKQCFQNTVFTVWITLCSLSKRLCTTEVTVAGTCFLDYNTKNVQQQCKNTNQHNNIMKLTFVTDNYHTGVSHSQQTQHTTINFHSGSYMSIHTARDCHLQMTILMSWIHWSWSTTSTPTPVMVSDWHNNALPYVHLNKCYHWVNQPWRHHTSNCQNLAFSKFVICYNWHICNKCLAHLLQWCL